MDDDIPNSDISSIDISTVETLPTFKGTFICVNCVEVSKDVSSLCSNEEEDLKKIIQRRDQKIEKIEESKTKLSESNKTMKKLMRERGLEKHLLDNLNKRIESQISELGETIKSSLLEEIQSSLTKVESQVEKSYANVTKASNTPMLTSGLKSIVKEARYEEIKEKKDHDQRQKNIVIHGVDEQEDEGTSDGDKKFLDALVKTIKIQTPSIKSVSRIGRKAEDKKRPIKVVLGSEKEKMTFLRNLAPLKDNQKYKGVSVTEDLTQTERLVLKEWADKKEKNSTWMILSGFGALEGIQKTGITTRSSHESNPLNPTEDNDNKFDDNEKHGQMAKKKKSRKCLTTGKSCSSTNDRTLLKKKMLQEKESSSSSDEENHHTKKSFSNTGYLLVPSGYLQLLPKKSEERVSSDRDEDIMDEPYDVIGNETTNANEITDVGETESISDGNAIWKKEFKCNYKDCAEEKDDDVKTGGGNIEMQAEETRAEDEEEDEEVEDEEEKEENYDISTQIARDREREQLIFNEYIEKKVVNSETNSTTLKNICNKKSVIIVSDSMLNGIEDP
ncbi:myb-like protein X [Clytia hemisphaerica]|uniref:myb-like protein X n=1 Tax=Clytia hemisphaerica TaxID=252671 RepID=UPI0034D4687B